MNKYIVALILTLLGWTQIQAQNSDLRSAPTPPTFKVTLNYYQPDGATVTVMLPNGTKVENGGAVTVGTTVALSVVMEPTTKLTAITVFDGQSKLDSIAIPTAKLTTEGKYSYAFSYKMDKHAEFAFSTGERSMIQVSDLQISFLKQKLSNGIMEILVNPKDKNKFPDIHPWEFKTLYDYTRTGNYEPYVASRFTKAGDYPITITRPADANYYEFSTMDTMHITGETVNVSYRVDAINGGNWAIDAKVNGEKLGSGFEVEVGRQIDFTLVTDPGFRLSEIRLNDKTIITDFTGTLGADRKGIYSYTTPAITAASAYQFFTVKKSNLADLTTLTVNNLIQTEGMLKPVTVTGAPEGVTFKVEYEIGGVWTETLNQSLPVGTYNVRITHSEDLVYLDWSKEVKLEVKAAEAPKKIDITEIKLPTPGNIEEGQSLSACTLTGGEAKAGEETVAGSFVWMNPNDTAVIGKELYSILFVPTSSDYATKDTTISVEVIPVYTVTTSSNPFGHIVYKTVQNANNRYAKGTVIQLEAIAEPNYQFSGWSDGVTAATRSVTVEKNVALYAQFDSILYKVEVKKPANGTLTVTAGGQAIAQSTYLLQGTLLSITATPDDNYQVNQVTVNGALINNGSYVMEADATVAATFSEKPATSHLVNVADLTHGSVTLTANDAPITPGAAVEKNTVVTINAIADKGYTLAANGIKVKGATLSGNTFTVGDNDVTVSVSFQPEQYELTTSATASAGKITLEKVTETGKTSFSDIKADYLTKLIVTLTHDKAADYRFINMTANAATIQSGDTVTVTGPLSIVANYAEKIDLTSLIKEDKQEHTYAGIARSYEVRVQGYSGLSFDVTYRQNGQTVTPTNAGIYDVVITRKADDLFKAVTKTITSGLTINKARMALKSRPTIATDANGNVTSITNVELTQDYTGMEWNPTTPNSLNSSRSMLRADVGFTGQTENNKVNILRFKPASDNYEPLDYSVPVGQVEEVAVYLNFAKAYNAGLEIQTGDRVPVGTVLTIEPTSWEGMRFSGWYKMEGGRTLTVKIEQESTFSAVFASLKQIELAKTKQTTTYNGQVQLMENLFKGEVPEGVVIRYLNENGLTATPLNAGTYTVAISYAGDEDFDAFEGEMTYIIQPQQTKVTTAPTATALIEGQALSTSVLSGGVAKAMEQTNGGTTQEGATVAGAFTWTNPMKAITASGEQQDVTFTSYDPNYTDATTKVSVTVTASATPIISFAQPENGTLTVKLADGTEITSGTAVAEEAEITVAVTANEGYELEKLTIGDKEYTSAPQTVTVNGSLTITATLKKKQSQGGSDEPSEPETIPDPVVAERTATTAVITWEKIAGATGYKLHLYAKKGDATPLKTYEFDAEGNLKAAGISFTLTGLTAGESYYVETVAITPQGEVKRGIELTGTPTGIEAIAEGSQLYTIKGAIVIVPTSPIEVMIVSANGRPIFHDEVSGYTQVTANAGIYVVVLKKGNEQVVEKVVVK